MKVFSIGAEIKMTSSSEFWGWFLKNVEEEEGQIEMNLKTR